MANMQKFYDNLIIINLYEYHFKKIMNWIKLDFVNLVRN